MFPEDTKNLKPTNKERGKKDQTSAQHNDSKWGMMSVENLEKKQGFSARQ